MGAGCTAALALLLAATALVAAQSWQPGDRLPAFSVPTLDGTLHVGGDAAAATEHRSVAQTHVPAGGAASPSGPVLVVCYDAAHPGSRAMWREPASLDALLKGAPADARFLLLPLNETTATDDAAWMRRQLQDRAAALQLAAANLDALFARLHFATQGLAALGGPLPALLREQWQELWPAVLAVPVGFTGDAAELERAAGPPPVGLPAPQPAEPANSSDAQPAGQQPGNGTAGSSGSAHAPGGRRPPGAAGSNVTASNATQSAPSAPRLLAYTLEASSFWVYERLASLQPNLPLVLAGADCCWLQQQSSAGGSAQSHAALQGAAVLVTLSQWPSRDPAAPCSWHALLMGAAQGGAAAVLFAAPPGTGPDLQQPDCGGSSETCSHPAVAAATVGHRFGQALQLALNGSERVNVTFGGLRGPGMYAGILPDGRLFEVGAGSAATPSLAAAVWEAQGRAYLQQVEEQASARLAASRSVAVPVFTKALMPQGEGVRAAVQLPSAAQLAGLDRLELDLRLGCPGPSDASCPEWDHVVQLFVCCRDPDGGAPPCDVCRKTPWSLSPTLDAGLTPGSLSLGVAPGPSSAGSGRNGGNSTSTSISLNASSASQTTRAIKDGSDSHLPNAHLARQCGRELGRWVSPYRRGIGRWLTDASPLLPLLVPGQQCTFTMQSTEWAGTWRPSLTLLFSRSEAAGAGNSTTAASSSGSRGGSTGRRTRAGRTALAPTAAPAATRGLPRPISLRVASSNSSMAGGIALEGDDVQPVLPAGSSGEAARLLPLPWPGGTLDGSFNRRQLPFQFETPAGVRRALLVATITGHGQDSLFNCAEFCPTVHVFTVNGAQQNVSHSAAGTLFGCADQVGQGTVPNQLGTWTLSRAGWCPGGAAAPWVTDVTDQLLPAGELNLVEYQALLPGGKAPGAPPDALPQDLAQNATALAEELRRGSGHIMLEASLVLYTSTS